MATNKDNIVLIPQGYYAITNAEDDYNILVTKRVACCTAFKAYDKNSKIGLLAHFDMPYSVDSMNEILSRLKSLTPDSHFYKITLHGGWVFLWSPWTRRKIKRLAYDISSSIGLNICIEECAYNSFIYKDYFLYTKNGEYLIKPSGYLSKTVLKTKFILKKFVEFAFGYIFSSLRTKMKITYISTKKPEL